MRNSLLDAISAGIDLIDALFESEIDPLDQAQRFMQETLNETPTRRSGNALTYDNIAMRLPCDNLLCFRDEGDHLEAIFAVVCRQHQHGQQLVQTVVDRLNQLTQIGEWESRYRDGYVAITFCLRMKSRPFDESVFATLVNVVLREISLLVSLIPLHLLS